jgi:hypothetical protein
MKLLCLALLVFDSHALRGMEQTSRSASGLYLLHIPKCAGASFTTDAGKHLPNLVSGEGCYDDDHQGRRMIAMLRSPRTHVLSQYFHCRTSGAHAYGHDFIHESFPEWIEAWSDNLEKLEQIKTAPFCCYHPVNMMAAHFSCGNATTGIAAHFHPDSSQILKRKVEQLAFVGLVEAYPESLCLLRIRETGQFPEECACGAEGDAATVSHNTHGSQKHNISDYSESVWEKVDKLTSLDQELYDIAKARFLSDIKASENEFQKKILCRSLDFSVPAARFAYSMRNSDGMEKRSDCQAWENEAMEMGICLPRH